LENVLVGWCHSVVRPDVEHNRRPVAAARPPRASEPGRPTDGVLRCLSTRRRELTDSLSPCLRGFQRAAGGVQGGRRQVRPAYFHLPCLACWRLRLLRRLLLHRCVQLRFWSVRFRLRSGPAARGRGLQKRMVRPRRCCSRRCRTGPGPVRGSGRDQSEPSTHRKPRSLGVPATPRHRSRRQRVLSRCRISATCSEVWDSASSRSTDSSCSSFARRAYSVGRLRYSVRAMAALFPRDSR
jgi:hypothetical protein